MYTQWYNGLFDRGIRGDHRNYLSNHVSGLETRIIVAKQLSRVDDPEDTYMVYTSFRSYVELYKFILATPSESRVFHEVTPESSRQKLRFDLDIKRDTHAEFTLSHPGAARNFDVFGEYIKDLVITTSLEVLNDLLASSRSETLRRDEPISAELDVMLFTSHGRNKRSYHIVLPRHYVCGVSQAEAFWNCCLGRCKSDLDKDIFIRFVDRGPYSRNAPLRMLWSGKRDGSEFRVKKYCEGYNYAGRSVQHAPLLEEGNGRDLTFKRKNTLHQSLVSFTEESEALPHIGAPTMPRIANYTDIDELTYQKCKTHIEKWDTNSVFSVLECEGSIIQLERHLATDCPICNREHSRDPFCYLSSGALYWHCGRAKGVTGILIARLQEEGVASNSLLARLNRCRVDEGSAPLEGIIVLPSKAKSRPVLMVFGEECEILPEKEEEPVVPQLRVTVEEKVHEKVHEKMPVVLSIKKQAPSPKTHSPLVRMRTSRMNARVIPQSAPVAAQRTSRATGPASWGLDWDN